KTPTTAPTEPSHTMPTLPDPQGKETAANPAVVPYDDQFNARTASATSPPAAVAPKGTPSPKPLEADLPPIPEAPEADPFAPLEKSPEPAAKVAAKQPRELVPDEEAVKVDAAKPEVG